MKKTILLFLLMISYNSISQQDTSYASTYLPVDESFIKATNGELSHDQGVLMICRRNNYDATLVMTNAAGDIVWEKEYTTNPSGANKVFFTEIVATKDSNYLVSGSVVNTIDDIYGAFCMKINELGDTLWTNSFQLTGQTLGAGEKNDVNSIVASETKDSSAILCWGYNVQNNSTYQENLCIAKLGNNGNLVWAYSYDADTTVKVTDIIEAPDSTIYVFGATTQNPQRGLIMNFTSGGQLNWSKKYNNLCFKDPFFVDNGFVVGCGEVYNGVGKGLMRFSMDGANVSRIVLQFDNGWYENFSVCQRGNGDFIFSEYSEYGNQLYVVDSNLTFIASYDIENISRKLMNIPNSGIYVLGDGPTFGIKAIVNEEIGLLRLDSMLSAPSCIQSGFNFAFPVDTVVQGTIPFISSTPIIQYYSSLSIQPAISLDRFSGCVDYIGSVAENENNFNVSVFPNVSGGEFEFLWNGMRSVNISVYDLMGNVIYDETTNAERFIVDLTGSKSGVYFYSLVDENGGNLSGKLMLVD